MEPFEIDFTESSLHYRRRLSVLQGFSVFEWQGNGLQPESCNRRSTLSVSFLRLRPFLPNLQLTENVFRQVLRLLILISQAIGNPIPVLVLAPLPLDQNRCRFHLFIILQGSTSNPKTRKRTPFLSNEGIPISTSHAFEARTDLRGTAMAGWFDNAHIGQGRRPSPSQCERDRVS